MRAPDAGQARAQGARRRKGVRNGVGAAAVGLALVALAPAVLPASAEDQEAPQELVLQVDLGKLAQVRAKLSDLGVATKVDLSGAGLLVVEAEADLAPVIEALDGVVDVALEGLVNLGTGTWNDIWEQDASTAPTRMSDVTAAIGADKLWAQGIDGTGVGVALIDTGVVPVQGLDRPGQVVNGPDLSLEASAEDARYLDTFGHGTHMAGLIVGNDGTPRGFKGVAPGAKLINLKVAAHDGATDVSQVIAAIDWVVAHRNDPGLDIKVLNLSYGTDSTQDRTVDPLAHAVESAWRAGIVVVTAAGNDGNGTPLRNPAVDPYVLAIGADDLRGTTKLVLDDKVADFSSAGTRARGVDVLAPGTSILGLRNPGSTIDELFPGAVVEDRFFRGSGTSQAAAITSGAAALLLQANPKLTPDDVKARLMATATPLVDLRVEAGRGLINLPAAKGALVLLPTAQRYPQSKGTGSLEASRGSAHIEDEGVVLQGELDVMGQPFVSATWAKKATAGTAWSGGDWNGRSWTGSSWSGRSWTAQSWEGRSWTGRSWTGGSWEGRSWTGRSWTGRSWTGRSWTGRSWTGGSWEGRSWTSAGWAD